MNKEEWNKLDDELFCAYLRFDSNVYICSFHATGKTGITVMIKYANTCIFNETIMRYEDKDVIEFKRNKIIDTLKLFSYME